MLSNLPHGQPWIACWVPIWLELIAAQQSDFPIDHGSYPCTRHTVHRSVLGLREGLRVPELARIQTVLFIPSQRPPGIAVELGLLCRQYFLEDLVDQGQRLAYRHSSAVCLDYA